MRVLLHEWIDPELLGELPEEVELLPAGRFAEAEVVVDPRDDLLRHLREISGLTTVLVTSAGTDWIEPHVPPGVTLANARGARDAAVAEWVVAAVLAMEKELFVEREWQRKRDWSARRALPDVEGRAALILGAGSIGGAVQDRLEPFGVTTMLVARTQREGVRSADDLHALLPHAEILIVLLPLTSATRGLVDARALSLLPDGALVVNAGRGAVVDTDALLAELKAKRLRAALDVVEPEPLPPDHPLWKAPGTFISPHVSGDSVRADEAAVRLMGEQLRRLAWGAPLRNVVDRGG
ncbi:MAG TPA: NAD(P)-dependent oxidoreductase [Solirubrobacteraceae bacterium]|nr:NAD(P)-dependent oxidoreductase [Solirubrobacteraceae bacterium]